MSLCTGAFVLAAAGLLDGRRATTHWDGASQLADQYPDVEVDPRVLYVDDGDILTSAGSAACLDLCLHLVRNDYGAEVANTVTRRALDVSGGYGYKRGPLERAFRDARAAIAMGPSNNIAREWIGKTLVGLPLELFEAGGE